MKRIRSFFLFLITAGIVFAAVVGIRVGPPPEITIDPSLAAIGRATEMRVEVSEPKRGLGDVRIELIQGERTALLADADNIPAEPWDFWGPRTADESFAVVAGGDAIEWLREGEATIRVTAERAGTWLRSPQPAVSELQLPVKLRPPQIEVLSGTIYVRQGGSEAVVYRVSDDAVTHGVRSGEHFFPGYPMPGEDERTHFALFGARYDDDEGSEIKLVAVDAVENVASIPFVHRYIRVPLKTDTIRLSDRFLQRVVPAILQQTPELRDHGNPLTNYLEINRDLRKSNNETIAALAQKTSPQFLWNGPFLRMRNAKRMSDFADRRTYIYNGEQVDTQDHTGYDLASVRDAPIQSAATGNVVFAGYLGIYGNTVVVDHGYGLQTLYAHLARIDVAEGDAVSRGQSLGMVGTTGLSGGIHLHFTVLLHGMPVDPGEWFDANWLEDRLRLKLGDALPA